MMRSKWFESVAEARRRAERRLPKSVYRAIVAGTEAGITATDNVNAFSEIGLIPRIETPTDKFVLNTTVMGIPIEVPFIISPVGVQAVHPDGELALARAAKAKGTAIGLSSFSVKSVEEVVAANPSTFFQMYWSGSRNQILERMERAQKAGVVGLIATVDWSFSHARDWGSPSIPEKINLRTALQHAPECLVRPQWLLEFARQGHFPSLEVPNMRSGSSDTPRFFDAYGEWMMTTPPTWSDLQWWRRQWNGPFLLKGICRVEDAKRAVDIGVTAISVSNHGGNNIDGIPATIRLLPAIANAVGNQTEVVLDGGIRRGSDIVKAIGLGARAVMLGRSCLWGLAANGQTGAENVLDILRSGVESTLRGLGRTDISEIDSSDLYVPDGFIRRIDDTEI